MKNKFIPFICLVLAFAFLISCSGNTNAVGTSGSQDKESGAATTTASQTTSTSTTTATTTKKEDSKKTSAADGDTSVTDKKPVTEATLPTGDPSPEPPVTATGTSFPESDTPVTVTTSPITQKPNLPTPNTTTTTTTTTKKTTTTTTTKKTTTTTTTTTTKPPETVYPLIDIKDPSPAPKAIPPYVSGITSFSPIDQQNTCPSFFNSVDKCYVGGYTGDYVNAGRIQLSAAALSQGPVFMLLKGLSITSNNGSAFYIPDKGLDVNVYLEGVSTLSASSSVTLNNKSGMSENDIKYDECSTLRFIGVTGRENDKLVLVGNNNRSCIGGRVIVNNCTLDLSLGQKLTSYANICIEKGGKVIFPNGSVISLDAELDSDLYFSCDYVKGVCTVYSYSNPAKYISERMYHSTGKTLELKGQSGYLSFDMPAAGVTLSMDEEYSLVTYSVDSSELYPTSSNGVNEFYVASGTDLKAVSFNLYLSGKLSAVINGKTYTESTKVTLDLSKNQAFSITFKNGNKVTKTEKYSVVRSSASILYLDINEALGSISDMHKDSNHETYCYGSLIYSTGESTYSFTSLFSIKGRGNATWTDEKKGYALKLYDSEEYDKKNKIDISGMGKSANWVLISNHRDRTLIRNALALTLAQRLGMEYAVNFVFVDVYMNGEYMGLYNLVQKIETGDGQINVKEAKGDSLEGGYLLEFDNYTDSPQITLSKSRLKVTVKSPDDLASYSAIAAFLNEAEVAIFNSRGYNNATGKYWYDYIDIESFAILWMVREYTMDFDATVNFRCYYDPSDGKLHGGPVWDFDNSMARTTGVYADPYHALIESGDRNGNCWLTRLMNFKAFTDEIVRLYNEHKELFQTENENSIYALAFDYYDQLSVSVKCNFTVWEKQLYNTSWNTPKDKSYDGHFGILSDFLMQRNEFWSYYIPDLKY